MDQDKINILRIFQLDGTPVSCEDYGSGHVNVTFLVVTDTGRRYILQKSITTPFAMCRRFRKTLRR